MPGLIRSASLTHYVDVARGAGLDPGCMLREFGLPPRCLVDADIKIPIDSAHRLLEASAERSWTTASRQSFTTSLSRSMRYLGAAGGTARISSSVLAGSKGAGR